MKLNRILSALLLCVVLLSSFSVFSPLVASAAGSESSVADANQERVDQATVIADALKMNKTAMEALQSDMQNGYVDYYSDGKYGIFVNRYTGLVYYANLITGQVLTSNPTDTGDEAISSLVRNNLMSQILLRVFENANTSAKTTMNSMQHSAELGQISVSLIKNGLRVNYAIGETNNRYLLPNMLTPERFNELFLYPFVSELQSQWTRDIVRNGVTDYIESENILYKFDQNEGYTYTDANGIYLYKQNSVLKYLSYGSRVITDTAVQKKVDHMTELLRKYSLQKKEDGTEYYLLDANLAGQNKLLSDAASRLRLLCPDYDFETMYADEKEAGYVQQVEHIPVVRCAIEYTLNADGTLNVTLPANSIVYDETYYTLDYIQVVPYFGAGRTAKLGADKVSKGIDGYVFYPDGSGMVLDFADLDGTAFEVKNNIYGFDSGYSSLDETVNTRGEKITLPVYGIVNEVKVSSSSDETVLNGFFAIMEEGASMSTLTYQKHAEHDYLYVYPTYEPYPADVYDLSSTISVGGLGDYIIVSDSRYTGVYNTRFVMLTDPALKDVAAAGEQAYYEASYVGMAQYYRQYLEGNGTIKAMTNLKEKLPLYVESFGAMDVLGRFMTFPITESIPLTTFEDVASMYADFKKAGIVNVNFRLTGFANGGMNATYPVKSRWAAACGGASGLKELLATAKAESKGQQNFGLFPEFDFMYLSHSATFDGMKIKGNVACMVDNRYASKQIFGSLLTEYKQFISLVITPDALPDLFEKFEKKYGKYDIAGLSVSTMGTDLNSNFDKKNSVNREQAKDYVVDMLKTMNESYQLMVDGGNVYSLKYASHILNIATDSSHYRQASYTVPFIGMILHSYVSYTGSPLNYAGNAKYDALRSIESGAAPYYILAANEDNVKKLKEDQNLSKYYGVSYDTWKGTVIETYNYINGAIGGLQDYKIVDHKVLIAERTWDAEETEANFKAQEKIFFESAKAAIEAQISAKIDEMAAESAADDSLLGRGLKVTIDREMLTNIFLAASQRKATDERMETFTEDLEAFCAKIESRYDGTASAAGKGFVELAAAAFEVDLLFYVTESEATDGNDYQQTNYTVDNGNVVLVTYQKGNRSVSFIINYNSYAITVRLNGEVIPVGSYSYHDIVKEG